MRRDRKLRQVQLGRLASEDSGTPLSRALGGLCADHILYFMELDIQSSYCASCVRTVTGLY